MNNQFEPPGHRQKGFSRLGIVLVCGGTMLLLNMALLVHAISSSMTVAREKQQLQSSPLCSDQLPQASLISGCRLKAPMTVVRWGNKDIGGRTQNIVWELELHSGSGSDYTASFDTGSNAPRIYSFAPIGAVVDTEVWNEKVMWVSVGGVTKFTDDYPGREATLASYGFIVISLCLTLFFLFLFIAGVRNATRS